MFTEENEIYVGGANVPWITQEGKDGDEYPGYVAHITDGATIGFKYFDCHGVNGIVINARGYATGFFEVKTRIDGPVLATLKMNHSTVWEAYRSDCAIPDGINALYLTYRGGGTAELGSFRFLH